MLAVTGSLWPYLTTTGSRTACPTNDDTKVPLADLARLAGASNALASPTAIGIDRAYGAKQRGGLGET